MFKSLNLSFKSLISLVPSNMDKFLSLRDYTIRILWRVWISC